MRRWGGSVEQARGAEDLYEIRWPGTDASVAAVNNQGLVPAVANGTVQITATAGAVTGKAQVTVAQVVKAVEVTPAEVQLVGLGATAQLTARARDANGHAVEHASFSWTSSDERVATVGQTGLVSAVDDGEAAVSASAGGVAGSAHVVVRSTIPIAIDVQPGDDDENPINLDSKGVTPVAILTTRQSAGESVTFDAADVDPKTVRFAGAAASHWALEDVDGDGDIDLILHFPTRDLDLKPGDTIAELAGRTVAGQPFVGRDTVRAF